MQFLKRALSRREPAREVDDLPYRHYQYHENIMDNESTSTAIDPSQCVFPKPH
jgi:hypothetical protein